MHAHRHTPLTGNVRGHTLRPLHPAQKAGPASWRIWGIDECLAPLVGSDEVDGEDAHAVQRREEGGCPQTAQARSGER